MYSHVLRKNQEDTDTSNGLRLRQIFDEKHAQQTWAATLAYTEISNRCLEEYMQDKQALDMWLTSACLALQQVSFRQLAS